MNDWRDDQNLALLRVAQLRAEKVNDLEQQRRKQRIKTVRAVIDAAFIVACCGLILFCVYLALWGGK